MDYFLAIQIKEIQLILMEYKSITYDAVSKILARDLINESNYITILNTQHTDPNLGESIQLIIMALCIGRKLPLTDDILSTISNYIYSDVSKDYLNNVFIYYSQ